MIHGVNGNIDTWASTRANRPGEVCIQPVIQSIASNGTEGMIYLSIDDAKTLVKRLQTAIDEAKLLTSTSQWIDDWV